jgi:Mg2+ and Co2+ transporter CorA
MFDFCEITVARISSRVWMLQWEYSYFVVMGAMLIACAGLYWRFRRAGWL